MPDGELPARLATIFSQVREVVERYAPDIAAVEKVFVNVNPNSTLLLGQARGAAIAALASSGLPVTEYTALQVKQAVVGNGTATKKQVQYMVERLVGAFPQPDSADAADALGVAITHLSSRRLAGLTGVR